MSGLVGPDDQADGEVGLAGAGSEGDRLQHLRAVLPCEVRVTGEAHPLFGWLVNAAAFKRWNGALLLVIELPDGSPGTIRADATDVFGEAVAVGGPAVVVDGEGLRHLRALVLAMESGLDSRRRCAVRAPSEVPAGRGTRK